MQVFNDTPNPEKLCGDQKFRQQNSIKINVILNSIKNPLRMVCLEGILQYQSKRTSKLILHKGIRQKKSSTVCICVFLVTSSPASIGGGFPCLRRVWFSFESTDALSNKRTNPVCPTVVIDLSAKPTFLETGEFLPIEVKASQKPAEHFLFSGSKYRPASEKRTAGMGL